MNAVLGDEKVLSELREDPSLIPGAVAESLRLFGTVCLLPRYTETGIEIDDVDIPAGSTVRFGTAPADRDPDRYPDPDRFDIRRDPPHFVTFGGGPHFCLGTHLARAEMCVSLELLLKRLPVLRLRDGMMPATGAVCAGCIAALEDAVTLDPEFVRAWAKPAGSLSYVNVNRQEPDSDSAPGGNPGANPGARATIRRIPDRAGLFHVLHPEGLSLRLRIRPAGAGPAAERRTGAGAAILDTASPG